MKCFLLCGIALSAIAPLSAQSCQATVAGRVIDASGNPIANATVSFLEAKKHEGGPLRFPTRDADRDGAFNFPISLKGPATFYVSAQKGRDGYPNTLLAFYLEKEPQAVSLNCGDTASGIVVQLGPKTGYIHSITVTDAYTGEIIKEASITLRRTSPIIQRLASLDNYISQSASNKDILIPSNTNISWEISARGYVTSQRQILNLQPSEKTDLSIQLIPASTSVSTSTLGNQLR
jgi:hypothetical protein